MANLVEAKVRGFSFLRNRLGIPKIETSQSASANRVYMSSGSNVPPVACATDVEQLSNTNLELYGGWFAVQVMSRHERRVASLLEYKGYEQFVPCRKSARRPQALFPGYLFCRKRNSADGLIVTTPGVLRILGYGGVPTPVSPEEFRNIHLVVNSGLPSELHQLLHVGAAVMVTEGPLRGVTGSVVCVKNQQRFAISISLLQRSVTVEMSGWAVRPVKPRPYVAAPAAVSSLVAAS